MTAETRHNPFHPKVEGTSRVHGLQPAVGFVVAICSSLSIRGNDRQTHYAAALCFQNELVRQHAASGFHPFAMNIGPRQRRTSRLPERKARRGKPGATPGVRVRKHLPGPLDPQPRHHPPAIEGTTRAEASRRYLPVLTSSTPADSSRRGASILASDGARRRVPKGPRCGRGR